MRRFVACVAVVGLLLTAGCGGDDDDGTSSEAIEEFCDGFNEVNDQFSNINVTDPGALENALDMLRDLDPPEEIADEYEKVLEGFEKLSEIDITDPNAVAEVQQDLPDAEEAFNTVGQFVEDEC
jgi:Asp-tRNA(Asn)/Glu-tRNA(Gln) amidotransferase C subunit